MKKGKTAIVELTGKRGSFCVSSAISPKGRLLFRIEKGHITADTFIDFLKKVRRHHPRRKIIIVTDRAHPHIARKVEQFVETGKESFALYYLPPYSPELDPDEEVWSYLKNKRLKSHIAMWLAELKTLTRNSMRGIQKRPKLVESFFHKLDRL
ncbi:MAG TPA: transposase [Hadesarchaea archaeon]|nr:transposase [Hadesarchaea archaeon]